MPLFPKNCNLKPYFEIKVQSCGNSGNIILFEIKTNPVYMLTFELVHKKRRPIKIYAIAGLVIGFLLIIPIGLIHGKINNSLGKLFWYLNKL